VDALKLERYSRHLLLPDIDLPGQERLLRSSAMIIGAGGLGSPAAMYLASSGVAHLVINDDDAVDLGNLQRQILHGTSDIGRPKVVSAADRLRDLNPEVRITTIPKRLDAEALEREIRRVDVVLDCSDNFPTRFDLNAACLRTRVPLVWGAAIGMRAQITTFDPRREHSPCLGCLYPGQGSETDGGCAAQGVFAPITGIVGSAMAAEGLKILLGIGDTLCGRLLVLDALEMAWRQIDLTRDPRCPVCADARARAV
jgi:molybdopterin/thiamine biosynthesis adenylyltransferase